jgi:hypothetical protein
MSRIHEAFSFAAPVFVALALLGDPSARAQAIDPARLAAVRAKLDLSGLASVRNVVLPQGSAGYDALVRLDPSTAGGVLTGESFGTPSSEPFGSQSSSASFLYEWRPSRGAAFVRLAEGHTRNQPIGSGTAALVNHAVGRLAALGIPSGEIGARELRNLVRQTLRPGDAAPTPPQLHRYKVFAERAIGGIPVLGSRAVFTYAPDRSFRRLLLRWPSLADAGHVLTSPLTNEQIAELVARDLVQTHEDTGLDRIPLRWVYDAVPVGPAEIALALRVQATLIDTPGLNDGERTRVRLFDPSRFDRTFCDVETNLDRVTPGLAPEVTLARFANYAATPRAARLRLELLHGTTVTTRLDTQSTLAPRADLELAGAAPIALFDGDPAPGFYEVRCVLQDAATGAPIAEDRAALEVRGNETNAPRS